MKKAAYVIVIIGLCLVINSLAHSIYDLWHKQDLLVNAQKQLVLEQKRNLKLKSEYKYSQTQSFVEEQAHDKLFMVKNGQQQVMITQSNSQKSSQIFKDVPSWKQWLNLFF